MDSAARNTSSSATALLLDCAAGGTKADIARAELLPLVYEELRRIARLYLRHERPHTAGHGARPRGVPPPDRSAFRRLAKPDAVSGTRGDDDATRAHQLRARPLG